MRYRHLAALIVGFALDSVLGDPQGCPHPVRLIGKQIAFEEGLVRDHLLPEAEAAGGSWPFDRARTERIAGAALAADVALAAPLATLALTKLCDRIHPALALVFEGIVCYQLLAARSLHDESMDVYAQLEQDDLAGARAAVGRIVGRDVGGLDEAGVVRAAVETVAENTSDGVVAPMLYMAAGGAPLAMMYKAVNTLDSMVGYKNERYRDLGYAPARLDDLCNIVPARVSGALMCAAAALAGFDGRRAWAVFKRDRLNHASPNAAHAEAACAGALGVQLGGASSYCGERVEKPLIGDATRPLEPADIPRANRLMQVTAVLGMALAVCVGFLSGLANIRKG